MQACDEALAGFSMAKHFTLLTQLLLYNIVFLSIIYKYTNTTGRKYEALILTTITTTTTTTVIIKSRFAGTKENNNVLKGKVVQFYVPHSVHYDSVTTM